MTLDNEPGPSGRHHGRAVALADDVRAFTVTRHTDRFEEMVRFYRDTLGWSPAHSWDRGVDDRGLYVRPIAMSASPQLEILHLAGLASSADASSANVALSIEVDDADELHDRFVDAGVAIARGLETASWGHRSFGVDDPDGLRIWFFHVVAS